MSKPHLAGPDAGAETRALVFARAEVRVTRNAAGGGTVVGYAAVFGTWSVDLGGFVERIQRGTFAAALAGGADVRFLVNHDPSLILARTISGTLRLVEDEVGLRFEADLAASPMAESYLTAVERRDIDGMSFRFYVRKEAWNFDASPIQRDLLEVDIDDVCLATYPAYTDTTAAVRSLDAARRGATPTPPDPAAGSWRKRAERLCDLAAAL